MKLLIFVPAVFCLFINSAYSQDYRKKNPSKESYSNQVTTPDLLKEYEIFLKESYDVRKALPKGYNKFGKVDYTAYVQDALNKHTVVLLPNFPILINDMGLKLKDNSVLLFQKRTVLILDPSLQANYEIINIHEVSNVKVFFSNIIGDRYSHLNDKGEWGFGISIRGSNNILVVNPKISETWGDGIYIGQLSDVPSTNVRIINAEINDARRNGISITSGKDIDIISPFLSNTNGTNPQSGIDIEPNSNRDVIKNIRIIDAITFNNKWSGILIALHAFEGTANKSVDITILNHRDIESKHGFAFHGLLRNINRHFELNGDISVVNSNYSGNVESFYFYNSDLSKIKIKTSNPELRTKIVNHKFGR